MTQPAEEQFLFSPEPQDERPGVRMMVTLWRWEEGERTQWNAVLCGAC